MLIYTEFQINIKVANLPKHPVTILENGDIIHIHLDSIISSGSTNNDFVRCNRTDPEGIRCTGVVRVTPRDIEYYRRERGVPLECGTCGWISNIMNKGEGALIPPVYHDNREYYD
ncbi:MAG: hypothetical protein ABIC04_03265 [Nanoarchaeota archaeon]